MNAAAAGAQVAAFEGEPPTAPPAPAAEARPRLATTQRLPPALPAARAERCWFSAGTLLAPPSAHRHTHSPTHSTHPLTRHTFAAMTENTLLVRNTLCANQELAKRVALFGTGLGTK